MDKDLVFQITSWYCCDCEYETEDDDDEDPNISRYLIKVFGVDKDGQSVSANVLQFTPYFFIKYPMQVNKATTERLREFLTSKLPYNLRSSLLNVRCLKKQDFLGFHNNEKFNFMRFSFKNQAGWRAGIRVFQKAVQIPGLPMCKFKLYESNVEPFLRMMHIRDIDPCGWVRIKKGYEQNSEILPTNCDIDVNCHWNAVERFASTDMAPMRIVSFDIECISSHGDFPVAKKDYKKVANELFQYYSKNLDMTDMGKQLLMVFKADEPGLFSKVFVKHQFDLADIEKRIKRNVDDMSAIIRGKLTYVKDVLKSPGLLKMSNDDIIKTLTQKLMMMGLPELEGDPIIQVGTTMHIYGDKQCSKRHILSLGTCDDIEGVEVDVCDTEAELLLKWRDLIVDKWNPDVMTGYNIFGFDFSYMYDRARELGIEHEFCKLGKIVGETCPYVEKNLSSSALGDNLLKFVDMNGRVLIDMMKVVQRDHKLDSYKLDNVAQHFMKMNKNDVSPNDIFRLYRGNSADRKVIAEYCVQDCALCNHLMIKLETLANNIGMSNVCFVPLSYIFMRGQSVKIFSLVAKQCREDDFLIPTISKPYGEEPEEEDSEGYEGAIVLPPKTGIYIDDPVSVLDYASLYPSSMISENLSHDTLVMDEKYDNLPGVDYLDIKYDIYEGSGDKKVKIGEKVSRFVQFPNNEKGVLPRILMKLLRQRKETRKKIEFVTLTLRDGTSVSGLTKEKDGKIVVSGVDGKVIGEYSKEDVVEESETFNEFQKAVLDGLQLAYKVTANSLYGQCGAKTSPIYLKDVAASTTATGRKMILLAQDFILKNYEGSEIVYGDSVTGYTPVVLRVNGQYHVERFEDIGNKFGGGKWIPCREASRQDKEGCELNSDLVEAWTDEGWTQVKRVIRHELAKHKLIWRVKTQKGWIDVTDDHSLFTIDNQKISPKDLKIGMEILHSTFDFNHQQHMNNAHLISEGMAFQLGKMMAESRRPVPMEILNAPYDMKQAFAQSYLRNGGPDGDQVLLQSINVLRQMLYKDYRPNDKSQNKIIDMHTVEYTGYVYDFTTDNHKFQAGVGTIIASNTDSLFVKFNPKDEKGNPITGQAAIPICRELGIKASNEIKKIIKPPHDLEWEKLFWPFILLSKKRYIANKYEYDDHKYKQSSMGVVLKRRDNANIVKMVYGGIIDIILNEKDLKKSLKFLNESLENLVSGKYPVEELVITKSLKGDYKDPSKIAHKVLADRMKARDPGSAPQVNDRIPYVYVETEEKKGEKLLQGEKIEHIDYVRKNKLKPDYNFYLTNQVMKPILQIYALILEDLPGYKKGRAHFTELYTKILSDKDGDETKAKDRLQDLREDEVKKLLFDPTLIKLDNKKKGNREITDFFKIIK